jgi:hypothetical protein
MFIAIGVKLLKWAIKGHHDPLVLNIIAFNCSPFFAFSFNNITSLFFFQYEPPADHAQQKDRTNSRIRSRQSQELPGTSEQVFILFRYIKWKSVNYLQL